MDLPVGGTADSAADGRWPVGESSEEGRDRVEVGGRRGTDDGHPVILRLAVRFARDVFGGVRRALTNETGHHESPRFSKLGDRGRASGADHWIVGLVHTAALHAPHGGRNPDHAF